MSAKQLRTRIKRITNHDKLRGFVEVRWQGRGAPPYHKVARWAAAASRRWIALRLLPARQWL